MPTYQNPQFWIYFLAFIYFYVFYEIGYANLPEPAVLDLLFRIYYYTFLFCDFYFNNLVTHPELEVHGFIYFCRNLKFLDLFLYISEDLNFSDFYQTRSSDSNCNFQITRSCNNGKTCKFEICCTVIV